MNQNSQSHNSRARRIPEEAVRSAQPANSSSSGRNGALPKNSGRGTASQAGRNGTGTPSASGTGKRPASSRPTPSRTVPAARASSRAKEKNYTFTAGSRILQRMKNEKSGEGLLPDLPKRQQNKVIRSETRRRKKEAKEASWQNGVVRTRSGVDVFLLVIILVLLALGSVTVFSASYPTAVAKGNDSTFYILKQLQNVLMGSAAMVLALIIPIRWYRGWAPIAAYVLACILLIAVLFVGTQEGVTERWINLGPINVQPSEIMKVALILMLAWYADKYESRMMELDFRWLSYKWNILYPVLILGFACVLVLIGKHLSGTFLVGMIGLLMLTVGGCRISWLLLTVLPAGIGAGILYVLTNPYAARRLNTFTNQESADKMDELYQTTQSLLAIGSGGLFGVGLGQSRQKYSYLTAAHTDFIFAIWCEEWGFLGAVVLIALFLLFIWRGYVIAIRAPDKFTMLTAFGITTHVALQAFLNIYVASSMFINTGVTLPFFSYGGSSTIVLMAEMGLLLSISRESYRTKDDLRHEQLLRRAGLD